MRPLKIGITGVRGVVGQTFKPELIVGFAQAFGSYLGGGRIVVSLDTRPSGPMVRAAVCAGLLAVGCEVFDLGVCPTPSMQLAVPWLQAEGGIAITAGHNPSIWNALKFVRADGLYLNTNQGEELLDIYHQSEFTKATWDKISTDISRENAIEHHLEILRGSFDVAAIRDRRFVVAVDCCNGACTELIPRWLAELGCEVLAINDDPGTPFPHNPEPNPLTMAQLRAVVKAGRADLGFAHDADGERLGLVTENGVPLTEEMTFALAVETRLRERSGVVVSNVSTSGAIELIAARHSASVIRTPVGQAYISEAINEHHAVLGGEGSGGIAVPEVHPTHDSAAAIGLILERLARTGERISEAAADLPRLSMIKHSLPTEPNRTYALLQNFRRALENEHLSYNLTDGIKVVRPEGWVHLRASNTESLIRVIVEAEVEEQTRGLLDWALDRLSR
jgi:phosphomannomutase